MERNKLSEIQMLKKMFSDKKASKWPKIITVIALIYIVIPTDFLPDFVPVIGWLDDLGVLMATVSAVLAALKKYKNSNI